MKRLVTAALTNGGSLVCVQPNGKCRDYNKQDGSYDCNCNLNYKFDGATCRLQDMCWPENPCGVPPHPNLDV